MQSQLPAPISSTTGLDNPEASKEGASKVPSPGEADKNAAASKVKTGARENG